MSLHPQPWPEPSDEVARVILATYAGRRAPMPVAVRDELGEVFADAQFAAAFAVCGPEGWSPGRLMLVTVLQAAEGLTDRQAADAVRDKVSWKYALGLALTDPGFDASVLSEFRTRLVVNDLQTRALDLMVARLVDKGLLKAGGQQRTDSTHVLAAVRRLNQVDLVGESVRAALEALAAAAPSWAEAVLDASWQQRYGMRVDSWRLPSSKTKRMALGNDFARDGHALLHAVGHPDAPGWLRALPAVEVLRRVLVQNTKVTTDRSGREVITLREADTDGLPPGRLRIASPYDLDARWSVKHDLVWCGFKLHISESCDARPPAGADDGGDGWDCDAPPNLITNVATTDACVPDAVMTAPIHQRLAEHGLLPAEHYLDSGYPSADLLVSSLTTYGVRLITPLLADSSPQARAAEGFDRSAFAIDWSTRTVTCPQGKTSTWWSQGSQRGNDVIVVKYAARVCQACPVRAKCTTSATARVGRQLTLRPQPIQQAVDMARAEQTTTQWRTKYARRAGVESAIAQAVKVTDARRARYRGLAKTSLDHSVKAAALNLIRLDAWWNGAVLHPGRTGHLSRLELTLAA